MERRSDMPPQNLRAIKNPHLAARVKSNSGDELEGGVTKIYPLLLPLYVSYKVLRILTSLDFRTSGSVTPASPLPRYLRE
jgi:hypothetical protein